jgi:hypothetical protein
MAVELDQLTCGKCGAVYHDAPCAQDQVRLVCICQACRPEPEPTITLKMITVVATREDRDRGLLGQSMPAPLPEPHDEPAE